MGSVSATPLRNPFGASSARATPAADPADDPAELKKKVARLKKLLAAANAHIEKLKGEEGAATAEAQRLAERERADAVQAEAAKLAQAMLSP